MVGADAIRHLSRRVELVEFFEADGEGLQRPAPRGQQLLLRESGDHSAVDAAAKEGADWHVADQMTGDRLLHGGAESRG